MHVDWAPTWELFFSRYISRIFDLEKELQGPDPKVQELTKQILEKVIPRLLRPLETGGRTIQPRLIHGDLWDGNTSTNKATNKPIIFDSGCIYAHNEGIQTLKLASGLH